MGSEWAGNEGSAVGQFYTIILPSNGWHGKPAEYSSTWPSPSNSRPRMSVYSLSSRSNQTELEYIETFDLILNHINHILTGSPLWLAIFEHEFQWPHCAVACWYQNHLSVQQRESSSCRWSNMLANVGSRPCQGSLATPSSIPMRQNLSHTENIWMTTTNIVDM